MARRKSRKKKKISILTNSNEVEAVSYARVSSEMQRDNFSVAAQHKANREFAKRKGWQIIQEYTDVGSGTDMDNRPAFQLMIEDAQAGRFQHIICYKLDRFSRSVLDTLEMLQELEQIGVTFSSSTEQFDFTTPIGKVLLMLLAAFAQLFIDNLRQEVLKGQTQRAEEGFWMQRLAFGYTTKKEILANKHNTERRDEIALVHLYEAEEKARKEEKFVADATAIRDKDADGVRLMFDLALSGRASLQNIADALHEKGYVPTGRAGRLSLDRWTRDSVYKALKNKFYAGYVLYREKRYRGNHVPIITIEEFDETQEMMRGRRIRQTPNKKSRIYLLSGLMRCAKCGNSIRATYRKYKNKEYRYYRCSLPLKSGKCDQGNVQAFDIESMIVNFFMNMKIPANWQDKILAHIEASQDDTKETIDDLKTRLKNIGILFEHNAMTFDQYEEKRQKITSELARLKPIAPISTQLDKIAMILDNFKLFWKKATREERHELMNVLIDHIALDQDATHITAQLVINPASKLLFDVAVESVEVFEIKRKRKAKKKKRG